DPGTFGYRLMTPVLNPLFRFWFTPSIIGKENIPENGALVIACNHIHLFDQCLTIISTRRPINYMAKKEYFEGGLRHFFRFAGCIPVNRNGKDFASAMSAITVLRRGGAIGIFPEGTRNRTDAFLLPFKEGAVAMAAKTGALVLPVGVTGDYVFRSRNLTVRFGKPFSVGNMTTREANEKLRNEIGKLMLENIEDEKSGQIKKIS
ncbi:MAG: 1-acyl-sn-glycerol-3-phosphate acyltransferase, partial [Clostridia bacterium]|nr:1-acyl-sn-glycerol-3-phosphate acyltransferase [Clostridia bacterium]